MTNARIREALTAGTNVKEKGPPVADGVLSTTPDSADLIEWRSKSTLDVAETSSAFLDDEDDGPKPKPHELYGKFTWKIENFSEISKRELRSHVFDVGNYKWYILVYPQGCDVCNHLSLFLCVADYDKLLPGWSHFAQFTIAVVNKDPKKSKYSDTLHRFCKKEHDWGWKKFMELSKVYDGFTVADTLVIKAQVQVILDKPGKPFRCLDPQYRRELVRVYLTNVEGIFRRFCEEKRLRLSWLKDDEEKFIDFWTMLSPEQQRKYLTEKCEPILKGLVKQFFNEKEVTSTLVMDALYSGCKQIEEHSRRWIEGKSETVPAILIKADRDCFVVNTDLADVADRLAKELVPSIKDDKCLPVDSLALRTGSDGEEYRRDSVERDERRLAELGRKTVELAVMAYIISERLEVAYRDAEALRRQDQLIAEEEEAGRVLDARLSARAAADKERRAKKKERVKQKREVERQRREAEDEERRRLQELRRLEAEQRAREVADKRREEEQQQQQQQQQQLQQQQRQQSQASRQRQEKLNNLRTEETAKKPAPATVSKVANRPQAPALSMLEQRTAEQSNDPSTAAGSSAPMENGDIHAEGDQDRAEPSSTDSSSCSSRDSQFRSAASSVLSDTASSSHDLTPSLSPGTAANNLSPLCGVKSRRALEAEVVTLRDRVRMLEWQLMERDAEVYALQAQLSELQPTEIADTVKEAAAVAAAAAAAAASERNGTSSSSLPSKEPKSYSGGEMSTAAAAPAGPVQDGCTQPESGPTLRQLRPGETSPRAQPTSLGFVSQGGFEMNGVGPVPEAYINGARENGVASRVSAKKPVDVGARGSAGSQQGVTHAVSTVTASSTSTVAAPRASQTALPSAPSTFSQPDPQASTTRSNTTRPGSAGNVTDPPRPGSQPSMPSPSSQRSNTNGSYIPRASTPPLLKNGLTASASTFFPASKVSNPADSVPSYRNAAAGVLPAGAPRVMTVVTPPPAPPPVPAPPPTPVPQTSAPAPPPTPAIPLPTVVPPSVPVAPPTPPMSPPAPIPPVSSVLSSVSSSSLAGPTEVEGVLSHRRALTLTETTGFSVANLPVVASSVLAFTPMPSKVQSTPNIDSPGLDDFAHMGLIDDLLTE